jgi:hypothetical protein
VDGLLQRLSTGSKGCKANLQRDSGLPAALSAVRAALLREFATRSFGSFRSALSLTGRLSAGSTQAAPLQPQPPDVVSSASCPLHLDLFSD